ncbi:MAG: CHAT domain-containing protein [Synechococcales cyanobacterium RM1_1_8]|nr:CHAT domain-containing protein [Synechococcales cyanobacterium RM1_1_8]
MAVNRDIQFSFKESVEPVYRQSVGLLVKSDPGGRPNLGNLEKARARIEALQVAELDNFFREACLDGQAVLLDEVVDKQNPTTAIVYPILLEDRLEVIVKVPGQTALQHHGIAISDSQVEGVLTRLRANLPLLAETLAIQRDAKTVYDWLIKPFETAIADSKVDTLVFVLDGALRNVPMGVLYDGQQYLVEKYALGVSLGLQLQAPGDRPGKPECTRSGPDRSTGGLPGPLFLPARH